MSDEELHQSRMRRLEESETASKRYGQKILYMHLSALSPTTRRNHAIRHGRIFTAKEMRDFWAIDENIAGCRCTIVAVMVDEHDQPLNGVAVARALAGYQKVLQKGYEWAKEPPPQT